MQFASAWQWKVIWLWRLFLLLPWQWLCLFVEIIFAIAVTMIFQDLYLLRIFNLLSMNQRTSWSGRENEWKFHWFLWGKHGGHPIPQVSIWNIACKLDMLSCTLLNQYLTKSQERWALYIYFRRYIHKNITRGTTDPGYCLFNLTYLSS